MKKILVTTDFSPASKSAIKFAINWSCQQKLQITFLNVHYILKRASWNESVLEKYVKKELKEADAKLREFVSEVYNESGVAPGKISTLTIEGLDADVCILDHVSKNPRYDCICISTRGAGKFKKILGTNTGNLITRSEIPVMAIPVNYNATEITKVMFATDLLNFEEEANQVIQFARPLKAKIEMIHFAWPNENLFNENLINEAFKKHFRYGLELHYEKNDAVHSLIEQLDEKIKVSNPSVVVMFTNKKRTFFQRMFLSSKSEELSFKARVPLLVFNKKN